MRLGDKTKMALALALTAASAAAAGQEQPAPKADMQQLLQNCDAHKFETTIHVTGDGEPYDSQVKVCGKQGQSDSDWIGTLKDIVDKTMANKEMPQGVKDQVMTAVNAEIVRLTALLPKGAPAVASLPPPRAAPKDDLAGDYSSLPPLPPPLVQPMAVAVAPATQSTTAAAAAVPAISVAPAPRLTLRCAPGRDVSLAEQCYAIERGDLLVVQADEGMASGLLLKFFRRGEPRGELRLPPMRAGQPMTVVLPAGICAGVAHSRIEIRASGAPGSSEAAFGPYDLRC
jgi:hypothetical protein